MTSSIFSLRITIFKDLTITDDARQQLREMLKGLFDSEIDSDEQLKQAQNRLNKLERVEKNLQRLAIEEEISFKHFKEHRDRIEAERSRLKTTIAAREQHQRLVKADFEIALELANQLDYLFNNGTPDEKRLLCEVVFKRLYLQEGKVTRAELNSPFTIIAAGASGSESVLNGGRYKT